MKNKCIICRNKKNLKNFKIHVKEEMGYKEINNIYLCEKCGLKLFCEEEVRKIWRKE